MCWVRPKMLPLVTFICGRGIFDDVSFRLRHANSLIPPYVVVLPLLVVQQRHACVDHRPWGFVNFFITLWYNDATRTLRNISWFINTVSSHARISCPTCSSISAILMKFVNSYLVQAKFLHADCKLVCICVRFMFSFIVVKYLVSTCVQPHVNPLCGSAVL